VLRKLHHNQIGSGNAVAFRAAFTVTKTGPSVPINRDLVFLVTVGVLAYSVCFFIVSTQRGFWDLVRQSGDNPVYLHIAQAIDTWSPQTIGKVKGFWGTGYGIFAVHLFSRADYETSLLLLSTFCGAISVFFTYRLYGRAVAAWYIFINAALMQRTLVGGSEPLFAALFLGSLLSIRTGRHGLGVVFASLAATVKPIGIFAVVAVLFTSLGRRSWRSFICYGLVAAFVGGLYAAPLILLTGSPFGNFSGYSEDWHQNLPISLPFYPIFEAAISTRAPLTNTIKIAAWIGAVIFVLVYHGLIRGRLRAHFTRYPEETLASLMMVLFQLSYNSTFAWGEFPRFIAPVVPFLLAQAEVDRIRPAWSLVAAPVFGVLGAVQIVGLENLLQSFSGAVHL
jgi:hypothetical protein